MAEFRVPEDELFTVPTNEIVNDPRAAGLDVPAEIPAEVVPQSWLEAMFPRTARADGAGATTAGLGLDALSLPGRAYASLARPEGESYMDAVARIAPPEVMEQPGGRLGNESTDRLSETILRDPATLPLTALSLVSGGGAIPAWLARMGWAGKNARGALAGIELGANARVPSMLAAQAGIRGAGLGAESGALMAGTRQAENVYAGRPVDPVEVGKDVGIGTALGVGAEAFSLLGRGLIEGGKRGLQQIIKPGTAKQGQEIKDFRRALDAGLLPEMAGYFNVTAPSAGQRFGERLAARELAYPEALAAADATGQRVNVGRAMSQARNDVADQMARGRLPVSVDDAQEGLTWTADRAAIPDDPMAVQAMLSGDAKSSALTLLPSVAQSRKSALWKEAFKDPTKTTARSAATKATARGMADELATISPDLANLNAELAPYYAAAPAMIRAAGPRGNPYGIGPMELLGFSAGAGAGGYEGGNIGSGATGGLLGALLVRGMRSPAAMRALYDAGRATGASAGTVRRAVPLMTTATDNARGGR